MALGIKILPEVLRTIAFGGIDPNIYAGIGTAFANPIRIIHIINDTDVLLFFSWDGVHDHAALPSSAFILLDITSNKNDRGEALYIGVGTRIYVRGTPTTGSVYLSAYYSFDN